MLIQYRHECRCRAGPGGLTLFKLTPAEHVAGFGGKLLMAVVLQQLSVTGLCLRVAAGRERGFRNSKTGFGHEFRVRIKANELFQSCDGLLGLPGQRVSLGHLVQQLVETPGKGPFSQNAFVALEHFFIDGRFPLFRKTDVLSRPVTDIVKPVQGINPYFRLVRGLKQLLITASHFQRRNRRQWPALKFQKHRAHIPQGFTIPPQLHAERFLRRNRRMGQRHNHYKECREGLRSKRQIHCAPSPRFSRARYS